MQRRIPLGPVIGVIGAAILIVSLVLDWYEGLTGFTVFEVLDLLLVALALATAVALARESGLRVPLPGWPPAERSARTPPSRVLAARRSLLFASAAALVVASQLLNDPPAAATELGPEKDLGIWLALAGAALMVAGSVLGSSQISLAVDVHGADRAARPADGPTVADSPAEPSTLPDPPPAKPGEPPPPAGPERP